MDEMKLNLLKDDVVELENVIFMCPKLFKVAAQYDGKIMDKRFVTFMEKEIPEVRGFYGVNPYLTSTRNFHRLMLWLRQDSAVASSYNLIDVLDCERELIVENKRFNFEKFKVKVDQKMNYYVKELNQIKQDIKDGEKRLQQYNQMVKQLNEFQDTFSNRFIEIYGSDFQRVTI